MRFALTARILIPGILRLLFTSFALASVAAAQSSSFRPALVGNGPKSVVNLINVEKLLQEGEPDGAVMFTRGVFPPGKGMDFAEVNRVSPGSRLLKNEVLRALQRSRFIPAIAKDKPVPVYFRGTVLFLAHTQPHLRVLANQDPGAVARFDDFVAPQEIFGTARSDGNDPRLDAFTRRYKNGSVVLDLRVDDKGKLLSSRVLAEEPRGYNLGAYEVDMLATAAFVPGFRKGKPVDCSYQMTRYIGILNPSDYGRY